MTPDPPVSSRRLQADWICGTGDGPSKASALPSELRSQVHAWKVWVVGGERDTQSPTCWLMPPIPALGTLRHGIRGQPGQPNTLSQGRKTVGLCTKEEATRVWEGLLWGLSHEIPGQLPGHEKDYSSDTTLAWMARELGAQQF